MGHSLNNQQKMQFMHREGSYSTRSARNGVNLLGWGDDVEEEMTLVQKKEVIHAAIDNCKAQMEQHYNYEGAAKVRKEYGRKIFDLYRDLKELNKEIRKIKPDTEKFQQLLVTVIKNHCDAETWHFYVQKTREEYAEKYESRKQIGVDY